MFSKEETQCIQDQLYSREVVLDFKTIIPLMGQIIVISMYHVFY